MRPLPSSDNKGGQGGRSVVLNMEDEEKDISGFKKMPIYNMNCANNQHTNKEYCKTKFNKY